MDKELVSLFRHAGSLQINLNEHQLCQFDIYRRELIKWNEKINLISEKTVHDIIGRHFLDSLTALQFIDKTDARIIDIGSGAGFPGIPLKIAMPALRLYLLEANRKKVSFLKHIARMLNLSETAALHARIENLVVLDKWKSFFDVLISRAAFKLPEVLHWGAFLLAPDGKLIALKSVDIDREVSDTGKEAERYDFREIIKNDINQKWSDINRKIIVCKRGG
jgi:16S rRNA (guanine527-N7)-methyltransferase